MSGTRILVVEDNPTARKLYRLLLQTEGYEVIEAPDARTALECLARELPALVLQDLLLPDLNGLELLAKIRALPGGRELPVVALSGFRSILEESKVLPLGFDATLVKPVERENLLATVRSLLPQESRRSVAPGQGHRILVVDDDPVQLKLVRVRLLDAGFEVSTAPSGPVALSHAIADPPALILSDVLMPEMDGFELCAAARRNSKLGAVPVVLMSAHFVEEQDGALGRQVGASALALRTPHLKEVVDAVATALTGRSPRAGAEHFPGTEHKSRLTHRLKQLAAINATMVQRCAHQAAQLSILGGVADALARSQNVDAVLQDVLAACLDAGGISKGALFRENAQGRMAPDQCVGFADAEQTTLETAFSDPAAVATIASGKPVALSAFLQPAAMAAFEAGAGVTSAIFVPVMVDGHCRAALFLGCGDAELDEEELLAFGRAIGAYVAQALALSGAFARVSAGAEAERLLFSSLDIEKTLQSLGNLVLTTMADICEIDLVEPDGSLRPAVAVHADPAKRAIFEEMHRRFPPSPERSVRYRVLASKEPYLCAEKTDAMRVELAQAPEHLEMLRAIQLRSHMVVPLLMKDRALGILSIGTSQPGRRYGKTDLALAERFAASAAVALENARLYFQAQEASRAKDEFLATVSHELRTPLSAVLGWTRMLRTGRVSDEKTHQALAAIERNAVAQTKLIEDILDVSGIVAGKLRLNPQTVSVAALIEAALEATRLSMEAKGIRCASDLEHGVTLKCDPERIQQVIWNLLSNAVKFTTRSGTIGIDLRQGDAHVEITVRDSGQGIRTELLPRIFNRFEQGDGSITRVHGGLGLGLAIARHLVELHGGTLEAFSDGEGKGARFRVRIPCSSPVAVDDGARVGSPPAPPPPEARGEMHGLRVLVVEDDDDARELLVEMLAKSGAIVTSAATVDEALVRLASGPHDLLISDIGLPVKDGLDLIRTVRTKTQEEGGAIPALAVTAYARAEDKRAALSAGYQMHLVKPFVPTELLAAAATLARRRSGASAK